MQIKHELFTVLLQDVEPGYSFNSKALEAINSFLADANKVYVNHSIAVLGKDLGRSPGTYRDLTLVVSVVYRDLKDTPNQLQNVSKKAKTIVTKSIVSNSQIPKPTFKTKFDKK